jgi:penicillin-binding protein 1C
LKKIITDLQRTLILLHKLLYKSALQIRDSHGAHIIRSCITKSSPLFKKYGAPFGELLKKLLHYKAVQIVLAAFLLYFTCSLGISFFLPRPLFHTPYSKVLYSSTGELMGAKIADDYQWRFPYTKSIPEHYKTALLTYEDSRFYLHPGIDPTAVLRAVITNIKHKSVVSGGSTISMQVMRLAYSNSRRSWKNKIMESILTLGLEFRYSKDEILALYASQAPCGGNIVGLEAAAWRYFGRDPEHLSWAEYALLAVLPNSPALIHPGRNRELLKNKRNALLLKLYAKGKIDKLTCSLALEEPLPDKPHPLPRTSPHLLETISQSSKSESRYYTTLDKELQERTQQIIAKHHRRLASQGVYNICALIIDNRTFEIRAYIGNTPENSIDLREKGDDHGYAVDIIRAPRSTGSILKPFLYGAMMRRRYYPIYAHTGYSHEFRRLSSRKLYPDLLGGSPCKRGSGSFP